ncbi:MAG: sulfatase [Armatimonadota bacterium]
MTRPNVVIIAIDSLRASHLGCYGYDKPTSPHIDALARESVVFDRAFAPGIPTMPSFTTLLSGLHPYRHGITAHSSGQRLSEAIVPLPQIAHQGGYVTIGIDNLAIQGNGRGSWFSRGFDYYSGYLYKPFSNQSEQIADRALRFITDFKEKPFLLFVHLWDPHTPYGPPPPFDTLHYDAANPDPNAPTLAEVKAISPEYYEAFLGEMKLNHPDDYNDVVAQYDGEISYVDTQVERILAHLKAAGVWENTIVVLMSDHGECFGEGNVYFDHHGLYDAVLRVALMCHVPGGLSGRSNAIVSTEDILPTLMELCGWNGPAEYALTGRSFAPALREGEAFSGRERIIGVESSRQASVCLRTEKWKFILPITEDARGNPLPDIYGQPRDPRPLLFDLENDPEEKHDVGSEFPDVITSLSCELADWRADEVMWRGGDDPLLENGLSLGFDAFMTRLRARQLFKPD